MEITFLGTSAMVPTKNRNHSAVLLRYKGENILFDCGEGTQRQFKIAGIKPTKITKILISHWHGDHCLGLPGLIQTLEKEGYSKTLEIYGPVGTKKRIKSLLGVFDSAKTIEIKIMDIKKRKFFENKDFLLEALPLKHGVRNLGYCFTEKDRRRINLNYVKKLGLSKGPLLGKLQQGKAVKLNGKTVSLDKSTYIVKGQKISYVTDTRPCRNALVIAEGSDLLIAEGCYLHELYERAKEVMHMTAREAALLAKQSSSKKLILTHFSQRYKKTDVLEKDAKKVFKNTLAAKDFMKVKV